ncbi:MAG TPA: aminotransferase class I/II-fold pyridoxal phosphate-dependent enzyme [Egibacteraceae bacterium]|nr:aminotransferase class I/II-fold pyridoxal phosphate-dependent enzyme [Egibacteraceae bacterium]
MSHRQPHLTARLQGLGTTVFAEMSQLAVTHEAVNLGQGFPDFDPPPDVADAAVAAIRAGHNQYAPGIGLPALRAAVADHQGRFSGLVYDPATEVTVTAGATEAMCATLQALLDTGDEALLFQPFYDAYRACTRMAGGVERAVTLRPPDFAFSEADLEAAVTPRTRVIVVNTPHNPTGKVFTADELASIARLCVERDLVAVTDEVYEHLVYDGEHVALASLPGMRERTVTISSAAKTFSVTGWKVGWVCAAPALTSAVRQAKQWMTYTNATPFQHAVVTALGFPDAFYTDLRDGYRARRDRLHAGLAALGFTAYPARGAYYVTADVRPLGYDDDAAFCRMLPEAVGVAAVPCSAFFTDPSPGRGLVRFAFCKTDELIDEGLARLRRLPAA